MSDKYKAEIEEILRQAGELAPAESPREHRPSIWKLAWAYARQSFAGRTLSLSPGRVMLVAVSLLLLALIMRSFGPGLVAPLAFAGLILFIIGYGMFFIHPPKIEKRWRGQVVEEGTSWWDRMRKKMK